MPPSHAARERVLFCFQRFPIACAMGQAIPPFLTEGFILDRLRFARPGFHIGSHGGLSRNSLRPPKKNVSFHPGAAVGQASRLSSGTVGNRHSRDGRATRGAGVSPRRLACHPGSVGNRRSRGPPDGHSGKKCPASCSTGRHHKLKNENKLGRLHSVNDLLRKFL